MMTHKRKRKKVGLGVTVLTAKEAKKFLEEFHKPVKHTPSFAAALKIASESP